MFVQISEPDFLSVAELFVEFEGFHLVEQFCHLNFQQECFLEKGIRGQ